MPLLSPPPVPQRLREMLKDYPEYIQTLQDDLVCVAKKQSATPPFERAIWMLEDALSGFVHEARDELEAAEASGDAVAIDHSRAKVSLMRRAASPNGGLRDLHELMLYFEAHKGEFE